MAVHQIWLHGEQMTLVPSFLQTIRDLTNEEKIYMADFGIELLKECCIQASKLTLIFQEIMDLKRCERFWSPFVAASSLDRLLRSLWWF